nr:uncharacterized protein LOC129531476 [Gorilla gorilla gorilla]
MRGLARSLAAPGHSQAQPPASAPTPRPPQHTPFRSQDGGEGMRRPRPQRAFVPLPAGTRGQTARTARAPQASKRRGGGGRAARADLARATAPSAAGTTDTSTRTRDTAYLPHRERFARPERSQQPHALAPSWRTLTATAALQPQPKTRRAGPSANHALRPRWPRPSSRPFSLRGRAFGNFAQRISALSPRLHQYVDAPAR